jgi:hypothetical protein
MNFGTGHLNHEQSPRKYPVNFFAVSAVMPPAGQSALWKYKGIYIQADQRVGQWSDVVSIPVAG